MVNVNVIESYKDYGKVVSITNGVIEAYVTVDIGPRIIRFGYVGGQNILNDNRGKFGWKDDDAYHAFFGENRHWESFGGYRVWVTPEGYPETYTPDDRPVSFTVNPDSVVFTALPDDEVGILKTITIKMDPDDANMTVNARVQNISGKEKEFAVWVIAVCSAGGNLIIPMNTNDTGYLPNRNISVWPYTDLSDSRLRFGKKYVVVSQDVNATGPAKLGFDLNNGTVHYVLGDDVFTKRYNAKHGELPYPDRNCSFETYTDDVMIEVESLSDVKKVANGGTNEITEFWSLEKKPCEVDFKSDNSIDEFIGKM
jgi:hypothetical protein